MKGNEARVVFFLHPVDQLKDGQVSRVKPLRSSFVVYFLFLLGLLLGLGVLVYVFLQAVSQQEPVPTTEVYFDTTAVTGRAIEMRSNQTRGNDSNTKALVTETTTEVKSDHITGNDSTTKAPLTERTTELRNNQIKGIDGTTETEPSTEIIPPGVMLGWGDNGVKSKITLTTPLNMFL